MSFVYFLFCLLCCCSSPERSTAYLKILKDKDLASQILATEELFEKKTEILNEILQADKKKAEQFLTIYIKDRVHIVCSLKKEIDSLQKSLVDCKLVNSDNLDKNYKLDSQIIELNKLRHFLDSMEADISDLQSDSKKFFSKSLSPEKTSKDLTKNFQRVEQNFLNFQKTIAATSISADSAENSLQTFISTLKNNFMVNIQNAQTGSNKTYENFSTIESTLFQNDVLQINFSGYNMLRQDLYKIISIAERVYENAKKNTKGNISSNRIFLENLNTQVQTILSKTTNKFQTFGSNKTSEYVTALVDLSYSKSVSQGGIIDNLEKCTITPYKLTNITPFDLLKTISEQKKNFWKNLDLSPDSPITFDSYTIGSPNSGQKYTTNDSFKFFIGLTSKNEPGSPLKNIFSEIQKSNDESTTKYLGLSKTISSNPIMLA